MKPEKKFLSPVLYPKNRSLQQPWFIKYKVEDWTNGGFKEKKYKGVLNLLATVEERLELATQYMDMMARNETLPNYKGYRTMPVSKPKEERSNIVQCCQRFLKLIAESGKEDSTIDDYKAKVKVFTLWLERNEMSDLALGGFSEFAATDFMLYLSQQKKQANGTYNAYRCLLKRIWRMYKKQVPSNPWEEIPLKRKNTKHIESYPLEIQRKIFEKLPEYDPQLWLNLQCIYYLALRPRTELRYLKVKHINFETGVMTVTEQLSKTHRVRYVNVYHKLLEQLRPVCESAESAEDYVFSNDGLPGWKVLSYGNMANRWRRFCRKFCIPDIYKLYGSKHTAGKKISKTMNPYITKEHFGHTSIKSTESYIDGIGSNELQFLQKEHPEFASGI